jgi:hypothetical protein
MVSDSTIIALCLILGPFVILLCVILAIYCISFDECDSDTSHEIHEMEQSSKVSIETCSTL